MRKNNFNITVRGFFLFSAMAVVIAVLLAAVNRLPSLMNKDFARKYNTIEDAGRSLGYDITAPAYFPEGISWPPSLIIAQKKPYKAVVMEFKGSGETETVLVVIQSLQDSGKHFKKIIMTVPREKVEYRLKGRTSVLQVGKCGNETPCSEITWQENGLHFTILLTDSPFELIKIAESMMR